MKVIVTSPLKEITTLDLDQISVHRLCLVSTKEYLGVGIKYLAGAGQSAVFSTAMLVGILVPGLDASDTTLAGITKVGLQGNNVERDRELIHDACRSLRNVINKESVIEEIGTKSEALADFYWAIKGHFIDGAVTERKEYPFGEWHVVFVP